MAGGTTVTFYGVRGSTPCAGERYERYGGNTSCVVVEADGEQPFVFDLGTGLRPFGEHLCEQGHADGSFEAVALLSHLHWDHVQGLPFFAPLGVEGATLHVFGPRQAEGTLDEVFAGLMRQPYFPIEPSELAGSACFYGIGADHFAVGDAKVRSAWLRHTSPTLGFRVEVGGVAVVYCSDHGQGCSDTPDDWVPDDVLELCDGADLLIHDAQHTCEEFGAKRHYGHSTADYAVHVARQAGVHTLALFHHCPTHSDDHVDAILRRSRELAAPGSLEVVAAAEGLCLDVAPPR